MTILVVQASIAEGKKKTFESRNMPSKKDFLHIKREKVAFSAFFQLIFSSKIAIIPSKKLIIESVMSIKMYTPACKLEESNRKWILINAEDLVLGRLAVLVADILRGKNKPIFTPHNDCGDYVVVINAEKVHLTGAKLNDKTYYWHTGYTGGLKQRTANQILTGKHPERVIMKAVERMMPDGPLASKMLKKLRVYAGSEHPHTAQAPEILDVSALNSKNKRRA